MAVDDIGPDIGRPSRNMHAGRDVAQPELPAHGDPAETERQLGRQFRKGGLRSCPSGRGVRDEPHAMAARDLAARKVEHMAEEPADRRAQDMQDIEAALCSVRHVEFTIS
jgi:hypothetical protein